MNRNLNGPQDVEKQLGIWFRSTHVTPLVVPLSESRHLSLRLVNKAFVSSPKILQQLFARLNLQGQPALTSLLQTQHIFLTTHVHVLKNLSLNHDCSPVWFSVSTLPCEDKSLSSASCADTPGAWVSFHFHTNSTADLLCPLTPLDLSHWV